MKQDLTHTHAYRGYQSQQCQHDKRCGPCQSSDANTKSQKEQTFCVEKSGQSTSKVQGYEQQLDGCCVACTHRLQPQVNDDLTSGCDQSRAAISACTRESENVAVPRHEQAAYSKNSRTGSFPQAIHLVKRNFVGHITGTSMNKVCCQCLGRWAFEQSVLYELHVPVQ